MKPCEQEFFTLIRRSDFIKIAGLLQINQFDRRDNTA